MKVNGIEFEFLGDSYVVRDRGRSYSAKLIGEYTHDEISDKLIGKRLPITNKKIRGIDMFCVDLQDNKIVGLLFAK